MQLLGFERSHLPGKKYDAILSDNGKKIKVPFGDRNYQHYHDKIGLYKHLDHNDNNRRELYRARHSKILDIRGREAYKVKYSPAYFSWEMLW